MRIPHVTMNSTDAVVGVDDQHDLIGVRRVAVVVLVPDDDNCIPPPSRPNYRHFVTPAEFTERFGPTQEDYETVVRFATSSGLKVVGGTRDGMEVQVKGSVAAIEAAFHVNMQTYQHPTENRTFFGPDREPTVDLPFSLWHVSGLDNYSLPHPLYAKKSVYAAAHGIAPEAVVSHATTGSGPSASFLGSDMRAAYSGGSAPTGAGQNQIGRALWRERVEIS